MSRYQVNTVLSTRNCSGVVQFTLEINTVNSSKSTDGSVGSFGINQAAVVDRAIEQACCCSVQSTGNASTLQTDTITCGSRTRCGITAALDQPAIVDVKRVAFFSKFN